MNVSWKVALAVVLSIAGSRALAQDVSDYMAASADFERMAAESKDMPRKSDTRAAAALATLTDHRRFLDAQEYEVKDLGNLMNVCGSATKVMMAYALHGVSSQPDDEKDPAQAAARITRVVEANFVAYQDEIFPLYAFVLRCSGRQVPLLTRFAQGLKPEEFTEVRRAGLNQARSGMQQTLTGILVEMGDSKIRIENKRTALAALGDTAALFASAMKPDARSQIKAAASNAGANAAAELRPGLDKVASAMSTADCTGLCAL